MALQIVRDNIGDDWEMRDPHREFGTKRQLTTWQPSGRTRRTRYTSEQMALRTEDPSMSLSWCGFKAINGGRDWISASLELVEEADQVKWRYITSEPLGLREGSATLDAKAGLVRDFLSAPLRGPCTRLRRDASPRRLRK